MRAGAEFTFIYQPHRCGHYNSSSPTRRRDAAAACRGGGREREDGEPDTVAEGTLIIGDLVFESHQGCVSTAWAGDVFKKKNGDRDTVNAADGRG